MLMHGDATFSASSYVITLFSIGAYTLLSPEDVNCARCILILTPIHNQVHYYFCIIFIFHVVNVFMHY